MEDLVFIYWGDYCPSVAEPPEASPPTAGASVNEIVAAACHNCSRNFVSETPITLTVTAAA